jgi:hypothetical protein
MMSRACIVCLASILLLAARAQQRSDFFGHLLNNQLFTEATAYLDHTLEKDTASFSQDTLRLHQALCYHKLNDTLNARLSLAAIRTPPATMHRFSAFYLPLLFVYRAFVPAATLLPSLEAGGGQIEMASVSLAMLQRSPTTAINSASLTEYWSMHLAEKYKRVPQRSPLLAGLMSAVLPGSGKLYAGYRYQAMSAFLMNLILGAQATEAYVRSGPRSVHFVLTASLFSVYYFANISGSAWAVKKKKRDALAEIDYEILLHYNAMLERYGQ